MRKTIIIGLDGANWELLNELMRKEEFNLPNLSKLQEKGVWGDMKSCLPPVTFPNWKCYSTGKNPGKLGVYWFERVDKRARTIKIVNSRAFEDKEIWDYLEGGNDYTSGVINMPTTYPPRKINGFMVCGGPNTKTKEYRRISSGYTYPKALEEELEQRSYRVHPPSFPTSKEERGKEVDALLDLIRSRFDLAEAKLKDVDFLHVTLFYLNVLQHFFWTGEPTRRAWAIIDDRIGNFMEKDVNVILMSDHGSNEITTVFNINTWLEIKGYLKTKQTVEDFLNRIGINRENLLFIARKLGLVNLLDKLTPASIQKLIPRASGVKKERKAEKLDWDLSKAFAGNQGLVYWLGEEMEGRKKLIRELEQLRDPKGKKIARKVYTCEEIYDKKSDRYTPEIIIDQAKGVHIRAAMGPEHPFETEDKWRAENKRTGLFLAYGENIKSMRLKDMSILDIAPTILHIYGLPIPKDIDGKVQNQIFKEGSDPAMREVTYMPSDYY